MPDTINARSLSHDVALARLSGAPATLLDLLAAAPAEAIAVVVPEEDRDITYRALRASVLATAEVLVAAGVRRGDRVAIVLPNGLPMIVSLLAASAVGEAAPLNPAFKESEFRVFL